MSTTLRAAFSHGARAGDRRNLAPASSEHVASELRQLVGRFLPAIYASDDSYTCRPCFSRIEKILKLRKITEDIEQEVMVNLKHAEYLYDRRIRRCRTRRYAQVRELRVDDRGSRCIGKCLQRAARRTCTFLLLSDIKGSVNRKYLFLQSD